MDISIESITANSRVAQRLDMEMIARKLKSSITMIKGTPGITYQQKDPKGAFLVLENGWITIHGLRSMKNARKMLRHFLKKIIYKGIELEVKPHLIEKEIVATVRIGSPVPLGKAKKALKRLVKDYRPSKLPALHLKTSSPSAEMLLFDSGTMVVFKTSSLKDVREGAETIISILEKEKLV